MQVKKNPKVDLNRNSGLYFVLGLTVVLFLTWRALEYKSYPKDTTILEIAQAVDDLKEDVPVTEMIKTSANFTTSRLSLVTPILNTANAFFIFFNFIFY